MLTLHDSQFYQLIPLKPSSIVLIENVSVMLNSPTPRGTTLLNRIQYIKGSFFKHLRWSLQMQNTAMSSILWWIRLVVARVL